MSDFSQPLVHDEPISFTITENNDHVVEAEAATVVREEGPDDIVEEKLTIENISIVQEESSVVPIQENIPLPWEHQKINHNFQLNFLARPYDPRDYTFHFNEETNKIVINKKGKTILKAPKSTLPESFSLQSSMSPIMDQGSIGSCVLNALAQNINTQTKNVVTPSRLFLYANSRILQGSLLSDDSGTDIATACSAILNYGTCKEATWPYNTNNYSVYPPLAAFQNAKKFISFTYTFINPTLASLQTALYTKKTAIVFGFLVYSSFTTNAVAKTGIVPMPNTQTEVLEGGHCMNIVGYDNSKQWFICANSWGTSWGNKGYCYIPYAYLLNANLAIDFCQPTFVY